MSRIAYIISAYKDAPHLARLVDALNENADFYLHVDLNADIRPFEKMLAGKVVFVRRHRISWGGWQQVEYQKELLGAVIRSGVEYGHIVCLSGQDYPLWSNAEIHRYLDAHRDTEFIMGMNLSRSANTAQTNKIRCYHFFRDLPWKNQWLKNKIIVASRTLMKGLPFRKKVTTRIAGRRAEVYFGSDYWAITLPCARYVYQQLCTEHEVIRYFKTSFVPSELCIQTLVFNSPYAAHALTYTGEYQGLKVLTPLHYIVYDQAIQIMTEKDFPALMQSSKMFCRKTVSGLSDTLIYQLEQRRKEKPSPIIHP